MVSLVEAYKKLCNEVEAAGFCERILRKRPYCAVLI